MSETYEKKLLAEDLEDLELIPAERTQIAESEILFEDTSKRSENVKHFRLKNGHYMAAVYDKPVHIKDPESGEFVDFADRFKENEEFYEANTGRFQARFPKKEGKNKFVTMEKDGTSVSWRYLPKASKRKNPEAAVAHQKRKSPMELPKFPHLKYEKEDTQTDLEYGISDNGIKENIILSKCPKDPTFRFELKLEGLKAVLAEDKKSVRLYSQNVMNDTPAFRIPPINMTDAAGVYSEDAHYELSESEEQTVLSIHINPEWLSSEERLYPVIIDPQVMIHSAENTVWKLVCLQPSGKKVDNGTVRVGYKTGVESRIYAGFNFPPLPDGYKISNAAMVLHQNGYSGDALYNVHHILQTWDTSSLTWSNQPNYETFPLDTVQGQSRAASDEVLIDITSVVKAHYNGSNFRGLVIKPEITTSCSCDSCCGTTCQQCADHYIDFYSSAVETDYMPALRIQYTLTDEYADHQQYESFDAGRAGVGSINLATGKLTFVHSDVAASGGKLPLTLSHIYRSDVVEDSTGDYVYGSGWKLSACQTLIPSNSAEICATYRDAQGRKHYFSSEDSFTDSDGTWYCDINGLGLSYNGSNRVRDEKGNTMTFSDQKLEKITDCSGNYNIFHYNSSGLLDTVTDNLGRSVQLYYDTYKLSCIIDMKGRRTYFYYDSYANLTQISYPDGTSTLFTYEGLSNQTKLVRVTDASGIYYDIKHELDSGSYIYGKIVSVTKFGTKTVSNGSVSTISAENGGGMDIDYRGMSTAVTDHLTKIRTVYNFDDWGRPKLSYEDLRGNSTLPHSEITVTDLREYQIVKSHKNSNLSTNGKYTTVKAAVAGTKAMHPNYLSNGSFKNDSSGTKEPSGWSVLGVHGECRDYVVNESYLSGYKSYKFDNTNIRFLKILRQTVDLCDYCISGNVLVASAWAKASSPVNTLSESSNAKFELRATLTYSNGDTLERTTKFDCTCTDWQYVAIPLEIPAARSPMSVQIEFDFSKNYGTCLVSNIRLTETRGTYTAISYGASGSQSVFGESIDIYRIVSTYDGITGTKVYYNANSDAVMTLTSKGTPYRGFYSYATYNDKHLPVKSMDYRGLVSEYTYNSLGNVTKQVTYHKDTPNTKMISQADYHSTSGNLQRSYDSRGTSISTGYFYDSKHELLTYRMDPNGQIYYYGYKNNNDLPTSVTALDAHCCCCDITNGFLYTANCLTGVTHNGFNYNFEYDALGRMKKVKAAGRTLVEHSFTDGEISTVTSSYGNGHTSVVTLDSRGNPTGKTMNGATVSTAEYDEQGNVKKTIDKIRNICYNYNYNNVGNLECVEMRNVTDNSYIGRKTYRYDSVQRPLRQIDSQTGQTYVPVYETINGYHYPDDATKGIQLENKYTDIVERDNLRRPATRSLTLNGASTPLMTETYGYLSGGDGRQTEFVESISNSTSGDTIYYDYDNSGNIKTVYDRTSVLFKYTYDGLNRLVQEENYQQSKRYDYTYDCGGNITSRKEYQMVSGVVSELLHEDTYAYSSAWKDLLTSYNGQTITYDTIGNPTTYRGRSLTWDNVRRLARYGDNTFTYDANGIRYQKNNTTYTLDGARILSESDGSRTLTYYYGTNGVIGFNYNGEDYYYRKNLQGDVITIFNSSGSSVAGYEYDAWGRVLKVKNYNNSNIGDINPFRYRSYYYDVETGLYYLQTRYYDPETGRFLNSDDLDYLGDGDEISNYNLFSYCGNNPVSFADYTGNSKQFAFGFEYDMGGGWKVRFDRGLVGNKNHIHVYNDQNEWVMNLDGSMSHENKTSKGDPPKSIRKKIKKQFNFDYKKVRKNFMRNDNVLIGYRGQLQILYYSDGTEYWGGVSHYTNNVENNYTGEIPYIPPITLPVFIFSFPPVTLPEPSLTPTFFPSFSPMPT